MYGSLLSTCYNHKYYLKNQKYLGKGRLSGYALYSLGAYPGIAADPQGTVLGEETISVEVYVYNGRVRAEDKIKLEAQPWSDRRDMRRYEE